ncbi:hypothetical protein ACN28S_41000 [Cystobacter fuscus]
MVAGVEVDSLDSLRGDRAALNKQPLAPEHLPRIFEWLREQGIRMMTPLHRPTTASGAPPSTTTSSTCSTTTCAVASSTWRAATR